MRIAFDAARTSTRRFSSPARRTARRRVASPRAVPRTRWTICTMLRGQNQASAFRWCVRILPPKGRAPAPGGVWIGTCLLSSRTQGSEATGVDWRDQAARAVLVAPGERASQYLRSSVVAISSVPVTPALSLPRPAAQSVCPVPCGPPAAFRDRGRGRMGGCGSPCRGGGPRADVGGRAGPWRSLRGGRV